MLTLKAGLRSCTLYTMFLLSCIFFLINLRKPKPFFASKKTCRGATYNFSFMQLTKYSQAYQDLSSGNIPQYFLKT